jgi:type I restriction enzyme S subunit
VKIQPKNWQLVKCGDVIDVRDGTHDTPLYVQEGIPLVTSKNLTNKGIDFSSAPFISFEDHEKIIKRSKVDKGDILFAMIGTIGNPTIVETDEEFSIKNVALFKFSKSSVSARYFLHLLQSHFIKDQFEKETRGGNQKFVSLGMLRNLKIPLPPLEEQKRIAAVLDKADEVRAKRRAALVQFDSLLQSVFLDMFGEPEHTIYKAECLDDVCEKITDGAHLTPSYVSEGVAFLRVSDVQGKFIDWSSVKRIPVNEHQEMMRRCRPEKGDVLYSKNGTIGIPRLIDWTEEFSFFVSLAILKPKRDRLLGEYLESFLKTPFALRQATKHTKTGTVSNLHLTEIKKIKLPLPPLDTQQKWVLMKNSLQKKREVYEKALNLTEIFFKSLQQRAFAGELFGAESVEADLLETAVL